MSAGPAWPVQRAVGSWLAWCGLVVTLGCSRGAPAPSRPSTSGPAPSTSGTTANAARRPAVTLADAENTLRALNARDARAEVRAHFMMRKCAAIPACGGECAHVLEEQSSDALSDEAARESAVAACSADFREAREKRGLTLNLWVDRMMASFVDEVLAAKLLDAAKTAELTKARRWLDVPAPWGVDLISSTVTTKVPDYALRIELRWNGLAAAVAGEPDRPASLFTKSPSDKGWPDPRRSPEGGKGKARGPAHLPTLVDALGDAAKRAHAQGRPTDEVLLFADLRTTYEQFAEVVASATAAHVHKFALIVAGHETPQVAILFDTNDAAPLPSDRAATGLMLLAGEDTYLKSSGRYVDPSCKLGTSFVRFARTPEGFAEDAAPYVAALATCTHTLKAANPTDDLVRIVGEPKHPLAVFVRIVEGVEADFPRLVFLTQ